MTVKEWVRQLHPAQLYIVLFFTLAFLAIEIPISRTTHSSTLLLNAYHMICNVIALVGCILSIKYGNEEKLKISKEFQTRDNFMEEVGNFSIEDNEDENSTKNNNDRISSVSDSKQSNSGRKKNNTFGWARINILAMVISCIFLASFCFSSLVECIQTLFHMGHLDAIHQPLLVMALGICGIILNIFCYITVGGFTSTQGFFIHVNKQGKVVLNNNSKNIQEDGNVQLTDSTRTSPMEIPRQKFKEMCRDIISSIFVLIASITVYLTDANTAKFVDPIVAIISAIVLFVMSYPYLSKSCMVLLQIIPRHLKIDIIRKELIDVFPGIVNVHEFHIWQLVGDKIITTIHIIFLDEMAYRNTMPQMPKFFDKMGLTNVTIQPEFYHKNIGDDNCLMQCPDEECSKLQCCPVEDETLKSILCVPNVTDEKLSSNVDANKLSNDNNKSAALTQTSKSSKNMKTIENNVTDGEKKIGCEKDYHKNSDDSENELPVGDETPCSTMAF